MTTVDGDGYLEVFASATSFCDALLLLAAAACSNDNKDNLLVWMWMCQSKK
jgi:hypothetical protein